MNDKNKQILLIVGAVVLGGFVLLNFATSYLTDRVADRVIQKLYKEYSPSPYGPGVDPDRINPNVFHRQQQQGSTPRLQASQQEFDNPYVADPYAVQREPSWEQRWEDSRR